MEAGEKEGRRRGLRRARTSREEPRDAVREPSCSRRVLPLQTTHMAVS